MIDGIYSGATALNNYARQQEVVSTNLAHLNTPGYRRQIMTFEEVALDSRRPEDQRSGAKIRGISVDYRPGGHKQTGRPLDLAVVGEGYFEFAGQDGPDGTDRLYSRNGVLFRGSDGILINQDGNPILGNGETIRIPNEISDRDLAIGADGTISANGRPLGKLSLVNFENPALLESNSQVYFSQGRAVKTETVEATVSQGARELSNSQPVTELVSMIVGSRSFESAQRAMRTISDALQQNTRS